MKKIGKLSLKERNKLIWANNVRRPRNKKKSLKSNNKSNQSKTIIKTSKVSINLPEKFNLHTNTDKTLQEMNKFREAVETDQKRLLNLNFKKMQYLDSSSALILAAEIDVWNNKVSQKLNARHKTWNTKVKALLCEMGFFELLGMNPIRNHQIIDKNTLFLKFLSGQGADGAKAKILREGIEGVIGKDLERKIHLYAGLTEAFTNTTQHAYDCDNLNVFDKWWVTAAYKKSSNRLIVSMYDRGKSIPNTIHKYKKWNDVKSYLNVDLIKKHRHLIEAAMQVSFKAKGGTRSKTQENNRGKGLRQLLDFIEYDGKLTIISGKGYCVFTTNNDKLETIERKGLKYPLQGTLIEWDINLSLD